MQRYLVVLLTLISFFSCSKKNSDISIILDKAENCMEEHPDSSLNILNTLQLNSLTVKEDRARYALLKSMALDKNYVDVTSDSLISIALDFYKRYGSPDYKLKAFYYNGKVKMYAGDYEGAMENYIMAEKYISDASDYIAIGRLYNAKMNVYRLIYDMEHAVKPAEMSAYYYSLAKDTTRYITALNSLSSILLAADKYEILVNTFNQVELYEEYMTLSQKEAFYANKINYKIAVKDLSVTECIDNYLECFVNKEQIVDWIVLARAYNELGEYTKAMDALEKYKKYNSKINPRYYYFASEIYNSVGNYELAYKHLKYHQSNSSKKYNGIFNSDAKFIEERYLGEQLRKEQRYIIVILVLSVMMIGLAAVLVFIYVRNILIMRNNKLKEIQEQKCILDNEYEKAIIEQNKLKALISKSKLTKDIVKLLEERMSILNNFIVSDISGMNMEKSLQGLKNYLSDNEKFLHSMRLSFELTNPKFISYLRKLGLSDWETSCCCLYCIGLNGSEIANFLNIKYFYKQSSVIRKKLGIQSATNIDKFLVEKLKELG